MPLQKMSVTKSAVPDYEDAGIPTRDLVRRYFFEIERDGRKPSNAEIARMIRDRAGVTASATTISDEVRRLRRKHHDAVIDDLKITGVPESFRQTAGELLASLIDQCQQLAEQRVLKQEVEATRLVAEKDTQLHAVMSERDLALRESVSKDAQIRLAHDEINALSSRVTLLDRQLDESHVTIKNLNDAHSVREGSLLTEIERLKAMVSGLEQQRQLDQRLAQESLEAEKNRHLIELASERQRLTDQIDHERERAIRALADLKDFKQFTAEETSRQRADLEHERERLLSTKAASEDRVVVLEAKNIKLGEELRTAMVEAHKLKVEVDVLRQQMQQRPHAKGADPDPPSALVPVLAHIESSNLSLSTREVLTQVVRQAFDEKPKKLKQLEEKVLFIVTRPARDAARVEMLVQALADGDPDIFGMSTTNWKD